MSELNVLKRAILYLKGRIVKTSILIVTIFVIVNFILFGVGISQATKHVIDMTRKSMNPVVAYQEDYQTFQDEINKINDEDEKEEFILNHSYILDYEVMETLYNDQRVIAANALVNNTAVLHGLDAVRLVNHSKDSSIQDDMYLEMKNAPIINLCANYFLNMFEFKKGDFELIDGRLFSEDDINENRNVCMITSELANLNHIEVGDLIQIQPDINSAIEESVVDANEYGLDIDSDALISEVEVVGIYKILNESFTSFEMITKNQETWQMYQNNILVTNNTFKQIYELNTYISNLGLIYYGATSLTIEELSALDPFVYRSCVYLLKDPIEVEGFVKSYKDLIPLFNRLSAYNDTFMRMKEPLETLAFFSKLIVRIVVVNAIVVLSLVTSLSLKSRSYEMGVLLSFGVTKIKIIVQMILELLIVVLIGTTLAILSGSQIATRLGDTILDYHTKRYDQYEELEYESRFNADGFYFSEVDEQEMLDLYHVNIDYTIIMKVYCLMIVVLLVSTIIPTILILKSNPKKLMFDHVN